jgi:hypothetical protein
MKKILFLAALIVSLQSAVTYAKDYGSELLSGCASIQLSSCKMTNRKVSLNKLSEYTMAFNCIKNGSSSNEQFDLGIPLPDFGDLGIGMSSASRYSSEICKEEIKKLNSAQFLKSYSETFDQECGRTLAGQYNQCMETIKVFADQSPIQSLKCSVVQSPTSIIINTKYVPGASDNQDTYRISSISGMNGVECDKDIKAGVNQYSSFACSLPSTYTASSLVVKLGNGVSCTIPIKPERKLEVLTARKYSCSRVYSSIKELDEFPVLAKAAMSGLCDLCLAENLDTKESDLRVLSERVSGCAVWAAKSVAEATNFCSVKASLSPIPHSFGPYPPMGSPTVPQPPPIAPAALGSVRDISFSTGLGTESADATSKEASWAESLCNGQKQGEIIQLRGNRWKDIPIDYLSTIESKSPLILTITKGIETYLEQNK